MPRVSSRRANRQGLTVLALLLLIIALAVAGFFVLRYLQTTS